MPTLFNGKPPGKIVFRVDAARLPGLSFGHISRCLILSKHLRSQHQTENLFLMRDYADGIDHARKSNEMVKTIPMKSDAACSQDGFFFNEQEIILSVIESFQPDWLIIDLPYPDINTSYFSTIKKKGVKILFIDDARFITPDVDVILNTSILSAEKYSSVKKGIRFLLGPEYFIFDTGKKNNHIRYDSKDKVKVVLTFGGSDPSGLTVKTIASLSTQYFPGISFQVVLGPGYGNKEEVQKLINNSCNAFTLIDAPENIYPYFSQADFVICAGGRTLYELAALEVPSFAIASIDHEKAVIDRFLKLNILAAGLLQWDTNEFYNKFICMMGKYI